jgi:hypothetical protein
MKNWLHRLRARDDEGHEVLSVTNRAVFVQEVVHWLIAHLLDVDERSA